jgi:hypothetical protein
MLGSKIIDSCRILFLILKILPLLCLYIYWYLLFMIKNKELLATNDEIHTFCTRQHQNFRQPSNNVHKYQAGVFYMGIKIYKILPTYIKSELQYHKRFGPLLKKFLWENSFYSLEEFYKFLKHNYLQFIFIQVEFEYTFSLHNTA